MRETVTLRGVVLYAQPVGEYDRRLVILTRERGKITAFARGVRRAKSPLLAAASPAVFANFTMYEGRDAYTLVQADVIDYFSELSSLIPGAWYGVYFLEFASWYGREGLEAGDMVNLIYVALKALVRGRMKTELIRTVYELKILAVNGDFAFPSPESLGDDAAFAAVSYCLGAPYGKLFSFELSDDHYEVFRAYVSREVRRTVDKTFKSLAVINDLSYAKPN